MFGTPTMNDTWWFMSVIILLYILFPLFIKIIDFSAEFLVCISILPIIFPYISSCPIVGKYFNWFLPFIIGMYMAKFNGIETLRKHNATMPRQICFTLVLMCICVWLRFSLNTANFDSVFALSIILLSFFIISKIPTLNIVLEHLGKYSGAIFMFHTFIKTYYFKEFIYLFKYPPIIFIVLTLICYVIANGLELLKKLICYNKLVTGQEL